MNIGNLIVIIIIHKNSLEIYRLSILIILEKVAIDNILENLQFKQNEA